MAEKESLGFCTIDNNFDTYFRASKKVGETLYLGRYLFCDLCPKPNNQTKYKIYNESELYATLAWVGSKPDVTLVNEFQNVTKEIQRGTMVSSLNDIFLALEFRDWTFAVFYFN